MSSPINNNSVNAQNLAQVQNDDLQYAQSLNNVSTTTAGQLNGATAGGPIPPEPSNNQIVAQAVESDLVNGQSAQSKRRSVSQLGNYV